MWMPVEAKGCNYMWNKHYYICYLCMCVFAHVLICLGTHMEVKGELSGVDSVSTLQVLVILLRSLVLLASTFTKRGNLPIICGFSPRVSYFVLYGQYFSMINVLANFYASLT